MHKQLFFICPTDYLELVINNNFNCENYFYSTLANSFLFNNDAIGYISSLLEYENIREITFVLSDENNLLFGSLAEDKVFNSNRLIKMKQDILLQNNKLKVLSRGLDANLFLATYFLIKKANSFKNDLNNCWFKDQIRINTKVYITKKKQFRTVEYNTLINNCFQLN